MVSALSRFQEFGAVAHWGDRTPIVMMWGNFDESGEHNPNLVRLTNAGCISSFAQWQNFEVLWKRALADENLAMFHMADFEANEGEFKPWRGNSERQKKFLNRLLAILTENIAVVAGASRRVPLGRHSKFRQSFSSNVSELIKKLPSSIANFYNEEISFVFARHMEFGDERAAKYCEQLRVAIPNLGICYADCPKKTVQLQAADLVAYEIKKQKEGYTNRYPWRVIKTSRVSVFEF